MTRPAIETRPPVPPVLEIARAVLSARAGGALTAYDVGAHVGGMTRKLLESGLFERVVAFEPDPENLSALAALARGHAKLCVVGSAVGAVAGERTFHRAGNAATGSLLPYGPDYETAGEVRRFGVPVTTLDAYRAGEGAQGRVGMVKIDTQGNDLEVLSGAARLLAQDRPLVIAEMIYMPRYAGQSEPDEIAAFMKRMQYRLHALFNIHATVEGRIAFVDSLFVPQEVAVPVSQRFIQLDNHESYLEQIRILETVCRERLEAINVLDAEVKRLGS